MLHDGGAFGTTFSYTCLPDKEVFFHESYENFERRRLN